MRKAGLVALGAAPGIAVGYLLLVGYLLNKVRPMAITRVPKQSSEAAGRASIAARSRARRLAGALR